MNSRDQIYQAAVSADDSKHWGIASVFTRFPLDETVAAAALATLVAPDKAALWLTRPLHELGGIPVAVAQTSEGCEAVLDCLGRLEHGVFG
jgi:uncharacterized protein (DUF2384 family)